MICGEGSFCGGLVASAAGNTFRNVYSSSNVRFGPNGGFVGGLIASAAGNTLDKTYAIGALIGGTAAGKGGLIGSAAGNTITNSFWDVETTGAATSGDGGAGLTTDQFRANMPAVFSPAIWGITRDLSYPYLLDDGLSFKSTLATIVDGTIIVTPLPISQLEKSNYDEPAPHRREASLAACFTMIARAIGNTLDLESLKDVKIDTFFWDDATQQTFFSGPVTNFATLGAFQNIGPSASLANNVIARMENERLVLLRGTYERGGQTERAWMLGTLFTSENDGTLIAVLANDPFIGQQVEIDR